MVPSRRSFLRGLATAAGVAGAARGAAAAERSSQHAHGQHVHPPAPAAAPPRPPGDSAAIAETQAATAAQMRGGLVPIETPDVPTLPWRMEHGVKVFDLRPGHVRTEFLPGRLVDAWGFNGSMPGPTIEVFEGDRVRLVVTNELPEAFSMHWHGLEVPVEMDGAPGISQKPIEPGGTFVYEFTLRQNGTYFYHSHMAMQEMMGLIGLFIIHPREAFRPRVDRDFGLIFQGWALLPNNTIPNSLAMEFNWLTINGKAGPATTPLLVKRGERVRIRMVNLGMDHHPVHLHGNTFYVTGTEAGRIVSTSRQPENTVLLGVAQARDIEFTATNPGDWMLHCHLPHHMMNQMASMVGPLMMSHGQGLTTGDMEPGMGIVGGGALAAGNGPAFGRTLGVGAEADRRVTNAPLGAMTMSASAAAASSSSASSAQHVHPPAAAPAQPPHAHGGAQQPARFPGYPQDMVMVMDDLFKDKPETHGLAPGWTAGMMGMMTLVRVLEPALFDKIQALKAEAAQRRASGRAE